jgi:hypothetical protein
MPDCGHRDAADRLGADAMSVNFGGYNFQEKAMDHKQCYQQALSNVRSLLEERGIVLQEVAPKRMVNQWGNVGHRDRAEKRASFRDHGNLRLVFREYESEDGSIWFEIDLGTPDKRADNVCLDNVAVLYNGKLGAAFDFWASFHRRNARGYRLARRIDPVIANDEWRERPDTSYCECHSMSQRGKPNNSEFLWLVDRLLAVFNRAHEPEIAIA